LKKKLVINNPIKNLFRKISYKHLITRLIRKPHKKKKYRRPQEKIFLDYGFKEKKNPFRDFAKLILFRHTSKLRTT